jgi:hypothetical protein
MKKYAWCTYANDETYFRAACVLHTNLKALGTRHVFVLILPFSAKFVAPCQAIRRSWHQTHGTKICRVFQ